MTNSLLVQGHEELEKSLDEFEECDANGKIYRLFQTLILISNWEISTLILAWKLCASWRIWEYNFLVSDFQLTQAARRQACKFYQLSVRMDLRSPLWKFSLKTLATEVSRCGHGFRLLHFLKLMVRSRVLSPVAEKCEMQRLCRQTIFVLQDRHMLALSADLHFHWKYIFFHFILLLIIHNYFRNSVHVVLSIRLCGLERDILVRKLPSLPYNRISFNSLSSYTSPRRFLWI